VFNVKPKVVGGEHADCGGAMISKLTRVQWPDDHFVDTIRMWQKEWFYITEPREAAWGAAPAFRSGPPTRLASWTTKSPDWGCVAHMKALQKRVDGIIETGVKLVDVVQIMLHRRLLPCQERAKPMWEHELENPATVRYLYGTTPDKIWGQLFQPQKECPVEGKYIGLDTTNPPKEVSGTLPRGVFGYSYRV
jgi:hypothetical protein